MLYTICKHIKNFFVSERKEGTFTIENSTIDLPFLLEGQYFMIEGSVLNDGIYQNPVSDLKDEIFEGSIVGMSVPKDFLDLVEEIESYDEKAKKAESPFISESFCGYSYTKATDSSGNMASWKSAFATRLNDWRKV